MTIPDVPGTTPGTLSLEEQANDTLIQMAQERGYIISHGRKNDPVYQTWGAIADQMGFPLVLVSPMQNGQAFVSFVLAGRGYEHDIRMARARRKISSVSEVYDSTKDRVSSVLMAGSDALQLAYALARLTGFKFPLTYDRIEDFALNGNAEGRVQP